MVHISANELTPLELEMLKFDIEVVGFDKEEIEFICNNLFRDDDGIAYYHIKDSSKKFALRTH